MKIIIIDDESKARDLLELLINEQDANALLVGKYATLEAGIEGILTHHPDVVFLDIEMPQLSGLQILEYIPQPDFEIIFATAYDKYAIKAFELSALDYLLKPIDEEKLGLALKKVGQKIQMKERLLLYEQNRQEQDSLRICIPSIDGSHDIIKVEDIIAIKAERSYSCIYTASKNYTLSKSLSYFVEKYMPLEGFERTHRSWVVNLKKVTAFNKKTKELIVSGKIKVSISRQNYNNIKNKLNLTFK